MDARHDDIRTADAPAPAPAYAPRRRDLPYKIPTLAGILSALMPGLGQVYVGYFQVGITVGLVFAGCITAMVRGVERGFEPLFGLGIAFTYLFGIVDATRRAVFYNRCLEGYGGDAVPPELALPSWGGSRAGGIVLIVAGLLLGADTMLDVDMSWLGDVWPLALVGLGVWLFIKGRRERA